MAPRFVSYKIVFGLAWVLSTVASFCSFWHWAKFSVIFCLSLCFLDDIHGLDGETIPLSSQQLHLILTFHLINQKKKKKILTFHLASYPFDIFSSAILVYGGHFCSLSSILCYANNIFTSLKFS